MRRFLLLVCASVLILSVERPLAAAETPSPQDGRSQAFQIADSDHDGSLDLAEYEHFVRIRRRHRIQEHFQRLDDDGDGRLNSIEVEQGAPFGAPAQSSP